MIKRQILLLFVLCMLLISCAPSATQSEATVTQSVKSESTYQDLLIGDSPYQECRPTYAVVRLDDGHLVPGSEGMLDAYHYQGKREPRDQRDALVTSIYEDHYERWMVYTLGNVKAPKFDKWQNDFIGVVQLSSDADIVRIINESQFMEAELYNKNGVIAEYKGSKSPDANVNSHQWAVPTNTVFCKDPKPYIWTADIKALRKVGDINPQFGSEDHSLDTFYVGKKLNDEDVYALKFYALVNDHMSVMSGMRSLGSISDQYYVPQRISSDVDLVTVSWCLGYWRDDDWTCDFIPLGLELPLQSEIFVYTKYHWERYFLLANPINPMNIVIYKDTHWDSTKFGT